MSTTIIINDFVSSRRSTIVLDDSDFTFVRKQWQKPDKILADLQCHPFYEGRKCWADLDPHHFHCMIVLTLIRVAALDQAKRLDSETPVVKSMHFLMAALVHCIQTRSESLIDLVKFNRINENEVTYDYSASLNMEIDPRSSGIGLKMIIDNT